jgi:hypothetical protein
VRAKHGQDDSRDQHQCRQKKNLRTARFLAPLLAVVPGEHHGHEESENQESMNSPQKRGGKIQGVREDSKDLERQPGSGCVCQSPFEDPAVSQRPERGVVTHGPTHISPKRGNEFSRCTFRAANARPWMRSNNLGGTGILVAEPCPPSPDREGHFVSNHGSRCGEVAPRAFHREFRCDQTIGGCGSGTTHSRRQR